jgi:hypothetical protein
MSDTVQIISTTIAAAGAIVAAIFSAKNHALTTLLKVEIDGRGTELLALTRKSSHAEGVKDQKDKVEAK